jgi:DMSO/TMAO reductase YedYZ heme-binding membrane subunit
MEHVVQFWEKLKSLGYIFNNLKINHKLWNVNKLKINHKLLQRLSRGN